MIGFAFRQLRTAFVGTAVVTGILVVALVAHAGTGRTLSSRLALTCAAADDATCRSLRAQLNEMYTAVVPYLGYLTITPVLIAIFWGAPLVSRELESGTAALAWSQSITRQRWLRARLIVGVSAVAGLGLALGCAVTWWLVSFTAAETTGEDALDVIDLHGLLLPALWITGLLIGVLIGTVIPRVVPAMAVTAVVTFVGAIAFNLAGGLTTSRPVGALQTLTGQVLQALPVLGVGALAALLAFRRIRRSTV